MARVAKIQGTVTDTIVVVPNTVEYTISTTAENNIRVTPVILKKVQNSEAFEIPSVIVDYLRKP